MDFEGQYLTYEEYKALGGTLDLAPFNLLEFEARKQIDIRTQNRLKNIQTEEIPLEVKLCVLKLIDKLKKEEQKESKQGIASESVGSYSVHYITDSSSSTNETQTKNQDLEDIILTNLYGVIVNGEHILYLGGV